ncbi:epimerase [uncultured Schumannella sp.]|uniref:epimerase n=1 Tax=uncultured Schumannella sp. TaxID=1195956 RepID=UPI0025FD6AE2|nr:DUF1731 domain-containing protein [uncultured Schumannella sp.]
MTRTVVVAGASGFMGRHLADEFRAAGDRVITIGRGSGSDVRWSDAEGIRAAIDGCALVINLAGRTVNCRYTARNRAEIVDSRVDTTRTLADAIGVAMAPPPLWINSSTATIYRHADDRPQDEGAGELGTGFSVEVAKAWEASFFERPLAGTRRVALRTAIVLGDGGVLTPLIRLVRLGLGGAHYDAPWLPSARRRRFGTEHRFGTPGGRQRFSWVHLADVVRVIRFLETHPELDGPINLSSPNPVDDRTFMAALRRVLRVPVGLPMHRWMLEPGAWVIRTETELVLKSRWVVPTRLLEAGYAFEYPEIDGALRQVVDSRAKNR